MDLTLIIAQLEQEAARYAEAAAQLRALQDGTGGGAAGAATEAAGTALNNAGARRGRPPGGGVKMAATNGKRTMSAEARARIGAATKARHAARRLARG